MPVYVSPMTKLINKVYDRYNYTVRRIEDGLKLSHIETIELRREDIEKGEFYKHSSVILATSGMMIERTMSFRLAKRFLQRKNFGIAVCGYCDPDMPGFKIKNAKRFNKIYFNYLDSGTDVYCRIENFKFTAHSDRHGLLKIVEKLKPGKVILLHGSENAIGELGKEIVTKFKDVKVLVPEKGKKYILLIDSIDTLSKYVELNSEKHLDFLLSIWPNPVSVVLNLNKKTSSILKTSTVAFRIPNHRFCQKLTTELHMPIISTSVNRSDSSPISHPEIIRQEFSSEVSAIFYSNKKYYEKASTIIDLTGNDLVLVRDGKIKFGELAKKYK